MGRRLYLYKSNLWMPLFAWFHLIFLLLTVGCQAIRYESAFLKEVAQKDRVGFTMSAAQLRQHLDELTYIYSSTIEQAADQVIAATPDRRVRQHALLWKINAIPAAQRAIFCPDPAVALIDAMAFSMQMAAYFESGRGRNDLGPSHIIALNAPDGWRAKRLVWLSGLRQTVTSAVCAMSSDPGSPKIRLPPISCIGRP